MVSLETRLKRHLLLGVLLVGVVLAVAVRTQVSHQQGELLDYQLEQVARALILSDLQGTAQTWDDDPSLHLDVQIWDEDQVRLYRSSPLIDFGPNTRQGLSSVQSGPQIDAVTLRVFTLKSPQRTVQVMHSQALRDALSRDAELEVLVPTLLAIVLSSLVVGITIRKGLAPIRELDQELGKRDTASLAPVELPHAPTEVAHVRDTFNRLLQQLDTSLQAHKRFIANAAHELRTPITALGLEVSNLASGQNQEQMQHTAARLSQGVQRTQHLLQQMLTLSRLESQNVPKPKLVINLTSLVQTAMVDLSAVGSHRGVEFAFEASGTTLVLGDPDELRLLLDNLLGNALKFSPRNALVEVAVHAKAQDVMVVVRDHGTGIEPELRKRIGQPFVRGNSAIEGSGLGLTIALEIAHMHGATLSLDSPDLGPGLQVSLCFSAVNPPVQS